MCSNCPHDMWDHELVEVNRDDDLFFGKCEVEGCDCERFEEGEYKPEPLENNGLPTGKQWEDAAGVICPQCKQEAFQFVGEICSRCHKAKKGLTEDKIEDKAERTFYKNELRQGTISMDELRDLELYQGSWRTIESRNSIHFLFKNRISLITYRIYFSFGSGSGQLSSTTGPSSLSTISMVQKAPSL